MSGQCPSILLCKTALPLKSPTGAFIATQTRTLWIDSIHKMWSCSFWTQAQKVVGYHREIHHFREEKSTKDSPPRNTPDSFCRLLHPTKSSLRCVGGIFFLRLNNSETTTRKRFWTQRWRGTQRWRARTVPWPQIFNSWKSCAPPGLHFFNASAFPKWSCWGSACRGNAPPSAVADRAAA